MGLAQKSKNKSNGTVQYKKAPFFVMTRTSIAQMVQIAIFDLLVCGLSLLSVIFGLLFVVEKKRYHGTEYRSARQSVQYRLLFHCFFFF